MPRPERFRASEKIGRLTALCRTDKGKGLFQCECGITKELYLGHVYSGKTLSCGCLRSEKASQVLGDANRTHGLFGTPTYAVWNSMKQRCLNKTHAAYKHYGARGITVCERWLDFSNFAADMGMKPDGLTLERRKNDEGYAPGNCFWATRKEQNNNMRGNVNLTYKGRTQTLTQWAEELGLDRSRLYGRIRAGWGVERAFNEPRGPTGPR